MTDTARQTRIARRVMPFIAADSALLPTDKWILATLRDMYKTVPVFRRDLRDAGLLAAFAGGIGAALGGAAVALSTLGALLPGVIAAGAVAVALTGGAVFIQARMLWHRAKTETFPQLQKEIGQRYIAFKASEVMRAWKDRRAQKSAPAADTPAALPTAGGLKALFGKGKTPQPQPAAPSAKQKRQPRR